MTIIPPHRVDELLQAMVRMDSVNTASSGRPAAEAQLCDYLENIAKTWHLTTRRLPVCGQADNLLILQQTSADKPWLLFDSHMDTVSVEGMTIEPFCGDITDGRLFGRGACDTKGTGAAMLWALKEFSQLPASQQSNNIALLFSVDEEASMTGIRSFITHDLPRLRDEGIDPQLVIVGEPTLLRSVIAHNGVMRWSLTTIGKAAHSAAPELGRSAIRMMMRALHRLEEEYIARIDASHPLTGRGVCHVTMIEGGSQVNIIPERCTATFDRRFVPGEIPEAEIQKVQAILEQMKEEDRYFKYELHDIHSVGPCDPEVSAAWLPFVLRTLKGLGYDDEPVGAPFATHAGELAAAGLPAIVLGPGDPTPAHTKNEWVALDEIRQGVAVYAALMRGRLDAAAGKS